MKCPRCQKASLIGAEYCVWCGTRLFGQPDAGQQLLSEADGVPEMKRHLSEMGVRLSRIEGRVTLISQRMGLDLLESHPEVSAGEETPKAELQAEKIVESAEAKVVIREVVPLDPMLEPTPVTPETLPGSAMMGTLVVQDTTAGGPKAEVRAGAPRMENVLSAEPALDEAKITAPGLVERRPEEGAKKASVSTGPPQKPPQTPQPSGMARQLGDWEQSLPGNWLSRIGIMALFIGLGFLAKLAYDRDWIGSVMQLLAGLGLGGVLLVAGHHWRKEYRVWAQALTGGGIAVLYLSIFASYTLNNLMSFFPTFALMFLVTILAVGIALRRESMAIAIIGIVSAFLVPIILGASDLYRGVDGDTGSNPGLMIGYILVLDAGIVGLSTFRKWRWFTLLGLGGSLAVYGLWYATSGHDGPVAVAEWSLTGIFLCFVAATTVFHVIWRRSPELSDMALMSLNAAVYFCVSYGLLWGEHREWLGLFSFGLAGLYAVTGYGAWYRSEENRRLSLFAFAIAIVFLTIAIPVQLHRSYASWITVAWAVEGAVLVWIAVRQRMPKWQLWGLGAFAMALVGLFAFNGAIDAERFRPFINDTFWAFTIIILAFYSAAYFLRRKEAALQPWFFPAMMLIASLLTLWLFSSEIVSCAESRILVARNAGATYVGLRNIENARTLGLVGLWLAYGFCLLVAGARRKWGWLRVAGYGLMAVACVVTVALLNHSHAMVRSSGSQPFINFGFGAFAICTVALYLFARVIAENRGKLGHVDVVACIVALGAASALTLWALSAEITTFLAETADGNLRNMMLAILWSGYGLLLVLVGAWKGVPMARLGGYGCVAVAAGISLITLNHGETGLGPANSNWIANWSFGGLFVCICATYLAAYVMANHSSKLLDAEKVVLPLLIVAANALSIFALSSEVLTYVPSGYGKSMGLTLLWAGYGLLVVVVGIAGKWRWVRLGGLALVSVAILKLFIVDTFTLHSGYRVAAYLTLGVLLLAGGFVYHRYADVIKGFIMDQPEKGAGSAQK